MQLKYHLSIQSFQANESVYIVFSVLSGSSNYGEFLPIFAIIFQYMTLLLNFIQKR